MNLCMDVSLFLLYMAHWVEGRPTGKGGHGGNKSNEVDGPVADLRGIVGPLGVGAEHAHIA